MAWSDLSASEVDKLQESCSNLGRWGADDERGTLNYIDAPVRLRAASLVQHGVTASLGRQLNSGNPLVSHRMLYVQHERPETCLDSLEIAPHGMTITHIDAVGHVYCNGRVYNGRRATDVVRADGLHFASVNALSGGIFTRGIVLDVCAARGVEWLQPGEKIYSADLTAAEELTGLRVEPGDAIFVHSGIERREVAEGPEDPAARPGLAAEAIPWLHDRGVAIYSGDCIEALPSGIDGYPVPLHTIGMSAMGLVMLDNPTLTALLALCAQFERYEFLLVCEPLPIPFGTGCAVNPLAVF